MKCNYLCNFYSLFPLPLSSSTWSPRRSRCCPEMWICGTSLPPVEGPWGRRGLGPGHGDSTGGRGAAGAPPPQLHGGQSRPSLPSLPGSPGGPGGPGGPARADGQNKIFPGFTVYDLLCISSFSPYVEETKKANQIKTLNTSNIRILTSDELKNSN